MRNTKSSGVWLFAGRAEGYSRAPARKSAMKSFHSQGLSGVQFRLPNCRATIASIAFWSSILSPSCANFAPNTAMRAMPSKLISTFGFKHLLSVGAGEGKSNPRMQLGKRDAFEAHHGVKFKNSAFSALNDSIDPPHPLYPETWVLINQCLLRAKSGPKLATQYRCGDVTAGKVLKGMDALIQKQFIPA
jgi:hypothetical protein